MEEQIDVIVIGAGMAGLAAARALAEAGRRVLIFEATERVGGRIHTLREGKTVIELGAEFIHGRPPDLWALIEEAGLRTYERTGDFLHLEDGKLLPREQDEEDPLESLKSFPGPDCSFADYVERLHLPEWQRESGIGYVEGFNAADAQEASAMALGRQQIAEDEIEGDRVWRIAEGYDRLPQFLLAKAEEAGAKLRLGAAVQRIAWTAGQVQVHLGNGLALTARQAIVTLPLGVLQAGLVAFEPEPVNLLEAARQMRMGPVLRFTLVFRRVLWPEGMSFLMTPELIPPVWWTAHPAEAHTLTGWVGGPRALPLLGLSADTLRDLAVKSLAAAFQLPPEEVASALGSVHAHDWQTDPTSRGAYSWVPVGGLDASAVMSEPVERTLFFAGEHTDTSGHWGTVHAAYRTGARAARQALES